MGIGYAPEYSATRLFARPFLPLVYLVAYLFSCSLHTMVVYTGKRVYSTLFEIDLFQTSGDLCNNMLISFSLSSPFAPGNVSAKKPSGRLCGDTHGKFADDQISIVRPAAMSLWTGNGEQIIFPWKSSWHNSLESFVVALVFPIYLHVFRRTYFCYRAHIEYGNGDIGLAIRSHRLCVLLWVLIVTFLACPNSQRLYSISCFFPCAPEQRNDLW